MLSHPLPSLTHQIPGAGLTGARRPYTDLLFPVKLTRRAASKWPRCGWAGLHLPLLLPVRAGDRARPGRGQHRGETVCKGLRQALCFFFLTNAVVFFFFFPFIFISWRLITLQYCSGFCHTLTWIMRQVLGPGALGRPRGIRGIGWRGRWEGGLGWGIHVNPWLIHVNV